MSAGSPLDQRRCGLRAAAGAAALVAFAVAGPAARPLAAQQPRTGQIVQRVPVLRVEVQGTTREKPEDVRAALGIQAGDTITYRAIERGVRRLYATGNFDDVKVLAQESDPTAPNAPVTLVVEVKERPFISEIRFRGLEHVSPGAITDTLHLRAGMPLQPEKVAQAEARARKLLADKGFAAREVEHHLEAVPGRTGTYRLIFDVDEGRRVAIADVGFVGNEVFSESALKDAMQTKPEGFLWFRQGTYDEERVRKDVRENIPAYYAERGYIDAMVTGDSLVVDPETGKAKLIIKVDEGPRYRLADFDIRGNHHFPSEELKKYFQTDHGGLLQGLGLAGRDTSSQPVFDEGAFQKATDRVRQLYNNQGYLYARVEPVIVRDTSASGEPTVKVAWEIQEGQPAYVNRVTINGNTYTHERVIREQILLLPGDVYSEELLIQSYRNIMALGFFESPLPMPKIEPNEKGDVDLTFDVKEKQTGSVNFGTAIGGYAGLSGFLGYDQPNLFGQAKAGHLRWEFGQYANNLEASYTDPAIFGSLISGSASVFSSYDRFFPFASEGRRRRTGGSFRFGFPLPGDRSGRTRVYLGYSLARTTYKAFDEEAGSSIFGLPPGFQSTVTVNLVRNTLDSPIFPTVGTKQELEVDVNGGPFGGDANFQKFTVNGAWYVPVASLGGGRPGARPVRFTLGMSAEAGAITGDASNFPFERFWMGGVQFGRPLRGYDESTITPLGYVPKCSGTAVGCPPLQDRLGDAYVRLSTEFAARINDNLSLSLFYDAGNLWRSAGEINPTRLLRGAGLGATIVTPFGPLGLDYAYGFDKDKPGWQLHFKFGPGF